MIFLNNYFLNSKNRIPITTQKEAVEEVNFKRAIDHLLIMKKYKIYLVKIQIAIKLKPIYNWKKIKSQLHKVIEI